MSCASFLCEVTAVCLLVFCVLGNAKPFSSSDSLAKRRPRGGGGIGGRRPREGEANGENGPAKGPPWAWQAERRDEEDNNNEEDEPPEGRDEEEEEEDEEGEEDEDEEEEEMDQDSDDFEHSEESGQEEEGEEGGRLHSPSLRNSVSDPNHNMEVSSEQTPRTPASLFKTKRSAPLPLCSPPELPCVGEQQMQLSQCVQMPCRVAY
ncbi:hypothetical protein ANANG_G00136160 [Anguilla anguilla]|uniref:Uncharacterized protein n=1 Tax=Anguilla anguilla TaxID=7936 RepID=A0A9D3RXK6_ANGAN|nr:hypothetical protein ANANG_G00136160 [Anguilla anguilla]